EAVRLHLAQLVDRLGGDLLHRPVDQPVGVGLVEAHLLADLHVGVAELAVLAGLGGLLLEFFRLSQTPLRGGGVLDGALALPLALVGALLPADLWITWLARHDRFTSFSWRGKRGRTIAIEAPLRVRLRCSTTCRRDPCPWHPCGRPSCRERLSW